MGHQYKKLLGLWGLRTLLLRLHRICIPLICGLMLLFSASCALFELSVDDLRWSNSKAEVVYICDRPLDVPPDINMWAINLMTGQLVTGEDQAELRYFVGIAADQIFVYDPDAPASSASKMDAKYGLTCVKPKPSFPDASATFFAPASELLRSHPGCPVEVAETVGHVDPRLLAVPSNGKKPSKAPAQAQKKDPKYVRVCMRPPGLDVDKWTSRDVKKDLLTSNNIVFDAEATKAGVVYIFDPLARPETVYHYGKDTTLRCPGNAPIPYEAAKSCGILDVLSGPDTMGAGLKGTGNGQTTSASGSGGQGKGQTTPTANKDGKGDGKTTETSSKDGKGPPLDFLDSLSRNLQYVAALSSGDTSGDPKDPNGKRYGMLGGTDPDGPNWLGAQAAASIFAIIQNPFKKSKDFIETIARGLKEGKTSVILDPKVLSKEMAEKLAGNPSDAEVKRALQGEIVESYGKAMAISLHDARVIMPYSRAQIFTAGWEAKYQAHHILEVNMFEKLWKREMATDGPAIILSKEQHDFITGQLATARKKMMEAVEKRGPKDPLNKADVWAMYQEVYKAQPNWLTAIEGYFK